MVKRLNIFQNFYDVIAHKYFKFKGRATREEYFKYAAVITFLLFTSYVPYIYKLTNFMSYLNANFPTMPVEISQKLIYTYITNNLRYYKLFGNLIYIIFLLPNLGIIVRRLHDRGHSAWYLLFIFIPPVLLITTMLPSVGDNKYGKEIEKATCPDQDSMSIWESYRYVFIDTTGMLKGRVKRKGYFVTLIINHIIAIVLLLLMFKIYFMYLYFMFFFTYAYISYFSSQTRRLRDAGFNPWWVLLNILPGLGQIILLIMTLKKSK